MIITVLKSVIGSLTEHHLIVIGLLFIGAILFMPKGLLGLAKPGIENLLRRRSLQAEALRADTATKGAKQ